MTREEFEALPIEERVELAAKTVDKATTLAMTMARALLMYGEHKPTCTDEKVCNCGLSPIQHFCADILDHFAVLEKEDETSH